MEDRYRVLWNNVFDNDIDVDVNFSNISVRMYVNICSVRICSRRCNLWAFWQSNILRYEHFVVGKKKGTMDKTRIDTVVLFTLHSVLFLRNFMRDKSEEKMILWIFYIYGIDVRLKLFIYALDFWKRMPPDSIQFLFSTSTFDRNNIHLKQIYYMHLCKCITSFQLVQTRER